MPTITRTVNNFNKVSKHGETAYGPLVNFDMPAFESVSSVVATFSTNAATGDTADRAFSLNGTRAHPSNSWASSGVSLNPALIVAGTNTFRASLRSQPDGMDYGTMAIWNINVITLTITYTEPGGGGGGTTDPGTVSVNKTVMTAGETLTVSVSGATGGVYRDVYIHLSPSMAGISTVVSAHGSGQGSWTITVPTSWCASYAPNSNAFVIRVYMVAYVAGGAIVGDGARFVTINVPESAQPTIVSFDIERIANVPAAITGYIKGYSKAACEIVGAAGALGSTISSHKITLGAQTINAVSGELDLLIAGTQTITATVTDSRGRTATETETIVVLDYSPPGILHPSVIRATSGGAASPTGTYIKMLGDLVFASLNGDNEAKLWGRVYEKGGTPTSFTEITGGQRLDSGAAINKSWIVELKAADLITEYVYVVGIPTSRAHINGYPSEIGGVAFGGYAEEEDAAVFKYTKLKHFDNPIPSLDVGDVLVTFNATSPALRWPGTVWSAITGRFLLGADATYEIDTTGGAATHTLTVAEMPEHGHKIWSLNWEVATGPSGGATATAYSVKNADSGSVGSGNAHNNMPPWIAAYMWRRTA